MLGRRVGVDLTLPAQTLACTVIGASLFGFGAMMADAQTTGAGAEHAGGQPLEPVTEGVPSLLTVPKEGPPLPEGNGALTAQPAAEVQSVVPQVNPVPDQVTPPLAPPAANQDGVAEDGAALDSLLVPLDSAGMATSSSGTAELSAAGAAADGVAVDLDSANLNGSREISRDVLNDMQNRADGRPWTFRLMAGVMYDDNIRFQQSDAGQTSDIILNAGFGAGYTIPAGSILQAFNATANGSYLSYLENPDYSGWNASLGISSSVAYGDFSGSVSLTAGQNNAADRLVGGFAVSRNYVGALTGNYNVSEKTRVTASMNLQVVDFVQQSYQDQNFNNNSTLSATLGANYAVTTKTRLGGNYMWSKGQQQDISEWSFSSINATAEWTATAKTGFTGSFGRQISSLDGVESGSGPGWIGFLNGTWQASDRMALTLGFARSAQPAAIGGNGAMNFNTINVGLNRRLSDRLSASLRVNYRVDDYQDLGGGTEFENRTATYWEVGSTVTWQVTTRAFLTGTYQFQDNASNLSAWNFSGNRLGLSFAYSF